MVSHSRPPVATRPATYLSNTPPPVQKCDQGRREALALRSLFGRSGMVRYGPGAAIRGELGGREGSVRRSCGTWEGARRGCEGANRSR